MRPKGRAAFPGEAKEQTHHDRFPRYHRCLDGIAQPALVVNGSNDIVIPTINSYHLYQHLPDAELMLLPDSGHGAHFQYVERFVRRVIDFLDVQPHDTTTAA
jgi:pimeloyl-ACP methyl ester carboxylesterase